MRLHLLTDPQYHVFYVSTKWQSGHCYVRQLIELIKSTNDGCCCYLCGMLSESSLEYPIGLLIALDQLVRQYNYSNYLVIWPAIIVTVMNCVASTFCYFVANTEHRLVIHTLVRDRSGLWNRHFNKSPFMYNIMYYLLVVAQKYDVFLRFNQVNIFVIAVLYCAECG